MNALKSWLTALAPEVWLFLLGGLFVCVTILLPKGLAGLRLGSRQDVDQLIARLSFRRGVLK